MECNHCADHITVKEKGSCSHDLRYFWCPSLGRVVFPEFDQYCCLVREAVASRDDRTQH